MTIAVLAVQGAFIEHERKMKQLGADCIELRKAEDLKQSYDGIILPGGESTVQGKLLRELGMLDMLQKQIQNGMPVLATCAGMILLAEELKGGEMVHLQTIPMTVKRNAYGRQLGSFHTTGIVTGIGEVPMTFIRAPYVTEVKKGVEVLACVEGKIVAVRYQRQLALAFHPELDEDLRIHEKFLALLKHQECEVRRNECHGTVR